MVLVTISRDFEVSSVEVRQRAGQPDERARALEGAGGAPPLHVEDGAEVEGAEARVG